MSTQWYKNDTIIFIFIFLTTLTLRLIFLDQRPLHHDESLHGAYSLYYFRDALTGFYQYNPLLHGPLLYHTVPWSYWLLGINKFAIRFPGVLLSTSVLFIAPLLKKHLSRNHFYFLLLFLALSPTFTFWSRFLRHDNFVFFSLVIGLASFKVKRPIFRATLIGLAAALHLCAKENFYIHFLFVIAYLGFQHFFTLEGSLLKRIKNWISSFPLQSSLGLLIFIIICLHYYSAGFSYWKGVEDLIGGRAFTYWFAQHHKERISGPFSYPFFINSMYEAWWLPLFFLHFYSFYKERLTLFFKSLLPFLLLGFLLFIIEEFSLIPSLTQFCHNILKIKIAFDYLLFFLILPHSVIGVYHYLRNKNELLSISHYSFFATLFTYSYLGEKVPWLALYPAFFGLIYFFLTFKRKHMALLGALLCLNIYQNYLTNVRLPSAANNLLTQVHTTPEYEQALFRVQRALESGEAKVLVRHENIWPSTWYFYGFPNFFYGSHLKPTSEYDYIFTSTTDQQMQGFASKGYRKRIVPLRSWWVPNYEEATVENFLVYFFTKKPWNPTGDQKVAIWERVTLPEESTQR